MLFKKPAQIKIGDIAITKLADGCLQVATKNGCVELYPDELTALFTFANSQFATEAGGEREFIQRVYDVCRKRNMPTEGEIQSLEIEAFNILERNDTPNNLVDVEDVIKYLKSLKWPSEWWLGEIEKQLKSMVK